MSHLKLVVDNEHAEPDLIEAQIFNQTVAQCVVDAIHGASTFGSENYGLSSDMLTTDFNSSRKIFHELLKCARWSGTFKKNTKLPNDADVLCRLQFSNVNDEHGRFSHRIWSIVVTRIDLLNKHATNFYGYKCFALNSKIFSPFRHLHGYNAQTIIDIVERDQTADPELSAKLVEIKKLLENVLSSEKDPASRHILTRAHELILECGPAGSAMWHSFIDYDGIRDVYEELPPII